jgi:hypothetical protein
VFRLVKLFQEVNFTFVREHRLVVSSSFGMECLDGWSGPWLLDGCGGLVVRWGRSFRGWFVAHAIVIAINIAAEAV